MGGTYVSDKPPHLNSYALILPQSHTEKWSPFIQALKQEVGNITLDPDKNVQVFEGIACPDSSKNYLDLVKKVESNQFAGLIFVWPQDELKNSPLMTATNVKRAYIMAPSSCSPQVQVDYASFIKRSVVRLKSLERSRIAVIDYKNDDNRFETEILATGLKTKNCWQLSYPVTNNCSALASIAELLFSGQSRDRPDGLIVADENFVEPILCGLSSAGIKLKADVDIVAHTSFSTKNLNNSAIHRLGFDPRLILQTAIDFLESSDEFPASHCHNVTAEFWQEVL